MSNSNKKSFYTDKKCAIVLVTLAAAWILGSAGIAAGFGNTGGGTFRNDCRPLFSYPLRGTFGSYPRNYETVSSQYPKHNDNQSSQIVHESSTITRTPITSPPTITVSGADKPIGQGNSESKPSYSAPQTVPPKPSQPEVPSAIGQHDEFEKGVVKQEPPAVKPPAIADALEQYRILEWNKADKLLRESLEKDLLSASEKFNAYFLLGAMAYQLGQVDRAGTYFIKAHKQDPSAMPSRELFPPQVAEFYKSVNRNTGG